ncbi:hypothetical protein CQ010_01490 [Arthrobacter sp. MYb211]|uniref:hypothetical protein n=1 Tax=unclassified Arthrobacter TaxID=235627 RepID=UPI000CFDDE61|nr:MULTISPECIES: hypothetical protein [unclassified Arthrobacter]PRA13348.1 hypothetical protein CQ015_03745 [Arthrobacter sp. MYb221]PRC10545.1 hypothetical protein CQ010_01490 [Arthrobacter sp. MYb211]
MGNSSARDARIANVRERQKMALKLRLGGATYEQIANAGIGYSHKGSVQKAVKKAIAEIPREEASEVLALELARLDEVLRAIWPQVLKADLWAVDRFINIQNRRAQYLGLNERIPEDNTSEVKAALLGFIEGAKAKADEIEAREAKEAETPTDTEE